MVPRFNRFDFVCLAAVQFFATAREAVLSERQGVAKFLSVEDQDKAAADRAWAMAEAVADAGARRGLVQSKDPAPFDPAGDGIAYG